MKHNQHTGNEVLTIYRNADHYIKRTKGQKEKGKQQFKIKISRDFVLLYMENVPYPPFRLDVMLWIVPGTYSDFFNLANGQIFECQKRKNRYSKVNINAA